MYEENLKYKLPISQTYKNSNRFHLSTHVKDRDLIDSNNEERQFHSYSSTKEAEEEYQQMIDYRNEIRNNGIIDITNEELKKEYNKTYNYYINGINYIFFISIFVIICSLIEIKSLSPTESRIAILILNILGTSIIFMLLISLRGKILIDSYGYISFYLFTMIESVILLCLFVFKISDFVITFKTLNSPGCGKNQKCPTYFLYLLILMLNIFIFLGFLLNIKFILAIFLDGFNILLLKKKTLFQKQIEINESKEKRQKIEFTDENDNDENVNNSMRELNIK